MARIDDAFVVEEYTMRMTGIDTDTAQPDWNRITVISLIHHSAAVIGTCMEQLRHVPNIVVVDNASDDDGVDIVRRIVPQAKIIRNKIGMGYGNAANQGIALVETEFFLMTNPDSIVNDEAIAALLQVADDHPEAGIICPQSTNDDGSIELIHDVNLFHRRAISPPYDKRKHEPDPQGLVCAEFVSGAVNLVRYSAMKDIGFFDPLIFLYFEDDDVGIRMRKAGYSLILVADVSITHSNGGSVRPSLHYKWEKFWNYGWGRLFIENKHQGRSSMLGVAAHHVLMYFFKALGYSVLFQGNKALRDWARLAGTLAYLIGRPSINPNFSAINEQWRKTLND